MVYPGDDGHPGERIDEELDWNCDVARCAGKDCRDCIPRACFEEGLCNPDKGYGSHSYFCKPEAVDDCVLRAKTLEEYNCAGCVNYSFVNNPSFRCPDDDSICRACYDPATNHFMTVEELGMSTWGQHLMGGNEWMTYALAATVVSASVVAEIRDIKLCSITVENCQRSSPKAWLLAIEVLQGARHFGFVSMLLWLVSSMVEMQGSDPLSICFNTVRPPSPPFPSSLLFSSTLSDPPDLDQVAVLFLLQVDEQLYAFGLSEETRTEIEQHGRVVLDQAHLDYLKIVKLMWLIATPFWLTLGDNNGTLLFVPFWGIVEAIVSKPGTAVQRGKRALQALGKCVCGFFIMFATMETSFAFR